MPLFEKLFDLGDDIKQKIGSAITSTVSNGVATLDTFIDENIPGGEQFTDNYAQGVKNIGKGIQDNLDYADQKANDGFTNVGQIPYWAAGHFIKSQEQYRSNAKTLAKSAGIDERAGDLLTEVAGDIAMTGAGAALKGASNIELPKPPQPQLVTAGGVTTYKTPFNLPPQKGGQVLEAVTAKNPEILALGGVKRGDDIISPEQAKHLTRRAKEVQQRVDKLPLMRDQLNEMIESGADKKKIKRFRDTIDDTKAMLHRKRSNVSVPTEEDPLWYQTTPGKAAKKQEEIARGLKAQEYLEAHHLFPKVLSSAFYDRMDWMINKGIAQQDDLVLMNNIAIKLGRKPGDYKSNMLNMRINPHNELHTAMDYAKDEFNEAEWAKKVSKAKDVDDLLILWRDTIKNTVLPTAEDALSMNKLDKTIESVSPKFTGSKKPSKEIFKNLRDKQLSIRP
jgi:hypothetical protein